MASDPVLSRPPKCLCGEPLSSSASGRALCFGCVSIALQAFIERWRRPRQCPCGYSRRDQQCAGLLEAANALERFAQTLQEDWQPAALLEDRTRAAIRDRRQAGESVADLAQDYGVPEAFVEALCAWQLGADAALVPRLREMIGTLVRECREHNSEYRYVTSEELLKDAEALLAARVREGA